MTARSTLTRAGVHGRIYFLCLCLLVISMPLSRYLATVSLILRIVNWVAEGNYQKRASLFISDRAAVAFSLIYMVSVAGLIWSADRCNGISNDLLHRSPTLFLPLIMATTPPPDRKSIRLLILLFAGSVTAVALAGLATLILAGDHHFRSASPFIPGSFYGNLIILAAFHLPLLLRRPDRGRGVMAAALIISAWLIFWLLYSRALSPIASLAGVTLYLLIRYTLRIKKTATKVLLLLLTLLLLAAGSREVVTIYRQTHLEIDDGAGRPQQQTAAGNSYTHDTLSPMRENGYRVYINICDTELEEAWRAKSSTDYNGVTTAGTPLRPVLYRYMSSKGVTRDGEGFSQMTAEDIRAVEKGITNITHLHRSGLYIRLYEEMRVVYLYSKAPYLYATEGSLAGRIDLWRASLHAIRARPLFGWGTGGIFVAVSYGLKKTGSPLSGNMIKPHSQYLYILLTSGVTGLIISLLLYCLFIRWSGLFREPMFRVFLIIFAINFVANNSLETQLGQNPFVFFSLFYYYFYPLTGGRSNHTTRAKAIFKK